ncbi:MAG: cytochrome ubiquinol oxidase subunit I, partial [Pseudonocardiaceae bacterium]
MDALCDEVDEFELLVGRLVQRKVQLVEGGAAHQPVMLLVQAGPTVVHEQVIDDKERLALVLALNGYLLTWSLNHRMVAAGASPIDLAAAREQMAISLGWHIILACLGVGMPALTLFAEWRGLRTGEPAYRLL